MIKNFIIIVVVGVVLLVLYQFGIQYLPLIFHPIPVPSEATNVNQGFDNPGSQAAGSSYHIRYDFDRETNPILLSPDQQFEDTKLQIEFYDSWAQQNEAQLYGIDSANNHISCQEAEQNLFASDPSSFTNPNPGLDGNYLYPKTRCYLQVKSPFSVIYTLDFAPAVHTDIWQKVL